MYLVLKIIVLTMWIVCVKYVACVHDKFPVPFSKLATCREIYSHSDKCEHYFQFSTFKNYKSDLYQMKLKFYVMTNTDANIVFTNAKSGTSKIEYICVIGAGGNKHSWINRNEVFAGSESYKADILSFLWATPIVVTLTHCGVIEVSIPNVIEPILKTNAQDIDFSLICIYSWNAESRWFYNCDEEEDTLLNRTEICDTGYDGSYVDFVSNC